MANRRQFIQTGLALSVASLPALATLPAALAASELAPRLRLERFVFDSRFAEASEVARHAAREGIPLTQISGDLTHLWYDELDLRWKRAPAPLAGMTTRRGLFVLETLAADHGMRVVYRGEHAAAQAGRIAHVLVGPQELVACASPASSGDWQAPLARAMAACPAGRLRAATLDVSTAADPNSARAEPLFSWIIAPRARAALRA